MSENFFRVSANLKRIIGRDLITDDYVALFELVKNSYDAGARRVTLHFEGDRIVIIDDGAGMSAANVRDKWLFVAYSEKRINESEAADGQPDYRERLGVTSRYAGSKGIGRFSCDRLGSTLVMQTQAKGAARGTRVNVSWDRFEHDQLEEFVRIPVEMRSATGLQVPAGMVAPQHGTVLEIGDLRSPWTRDKLLRLRAHLAKLIHPHGGRSRFRIFVSAPGEQEADREAKRKARSVDDESAPPVVNGEIQNFVFDELASRSSLIDVQVSDDGRHIKSRLSDRGAQIYEVREANPYPHLANSKFSCRLFYLNQAAKNVFHRRMGVPSVQFGSVFLFRNGFRIFPIGEEGEDTFQIDRRKQQGYARHLGTRDIISMWRVVIEIFASRQAAMMA
jgi:hypothetical protein